MERVFFDAKGGNKEGKELKYYNGPIALISHVDLSDSLIALLKNPLKRTMTLVASDVFHTKEIGSMITAASDGAVTFTPLNSDQYRALRGFSAQEQSRLVGYLDALGGVAKATDDLNLIVGRQPETLRAWIGTNKHWFV